jgi:2-polyprenyl-3-methyl-5-hydroxy-6-metoxy-1,4-benzoquinol methylase
MSTEENAEQIRKQYERREPIDNDALNDYSILSRQAKERVFVQILRILKAQFTDLAHVRVLVVGCGYGNNITDLLRWGFSPDQIVGCDLMADRIDHARVAPKKGQSIRYRHHGSGTQSI